MTTPEILARLIAATEDMIERLESCIADGNGELEDDRPAIAEARETINTAKATLHPEADAPKPKAADLRAIFDKIIEVADGDYTGDLAEENWLVGVDLNVLTVAKLMEVAYLMGRHDAETTAHSIQSQRASEATADVFRRINFYAPKPKDA